MPVGPEPGRASAISVDTEYAGPRFPRYERNPPRERARFQRSRRRQLHASRDRELDACRSIMARKGHKYAPQSQRRRRRKWWEVARHGQIMSMWKLLSLPTSQCTGIQGISIKEYRRPQQSRPAIWKSAPPLHILKATTWPIPPDLEDTPSQALCTDVDFDARKFIQHR